MEKYLSSLIEDEIVSRGSLAERELETRVAFYRHAKLIFYA